VLGKLARPRPFGDELAELPGPGEGEES